MINKISTIIPKYRFNSGWRRMGAVAHEKDTRTTKELLNNIEYFSKYEGNPVKILLPEIKNMNPKYLGLVSDTLEMANSCAMMPGRSLLNKTLPNNKTVLEMLLPKFVKAAKNEHKALDFAAEVISNTDQKASERFLAELSLSDILDNPKKSEIFGAAIPMVKDVAESTLKPPYIANNSLETFMSFIKILTADNAKPEKVRLFKDFSDFISKTFKSKKPITVPDFVYSDVPNEKILDNMKTLAQMAPELEKQNSKIDVVNFVLNNTNLK